MQTTTIYNTPHAYEISGPTGSPQANTSSTVAPTLVGIHGWLLSRAYWRPLMDLLSDDYPFLAYDLRGFGDSINASSAAKEGAETNANSASDSKTQEIALPPNRPLTALGQSTATDKSAEDSSEPAVYQASPHSLAAYAQDLDALLAALNIENAWLLGHSLGGSVALWAAYLFPERIRGVICLNAGGGIYVPKEFEQFRKAGQQMVKFRPEWLPNVPLLPQLFSRLMVHRPLDTQWGKQRLQDFVRADAIAATGSLLETTTAEEVHLMPQVVGHLQQPVHFITASQDRVMQPRYVHYLASFLSTQTDLPAVTELDSCGHMALVEQPAAVADMIRRVISAAALPNYTPAKAAGA